MTAAVVLGVIQGIAEWLPVSSEGAVAATYAFVFDQPIDQAIDYALWLHAGTVPSVLVVFRREIWALLREVASLPRSPSRLFLFLLGSTVLSGAIALLLVLTIQDTSQVAGAAAMGLIGGFMIVTGAAQLRSRRTGTRDRTELTWTDWTTAGVAQGFSVVPGLSRSGMTIATLLARRIERREALVISFLMSVPASVAASLYAGLNSGLALQPESLVAAAVAFVVGLATIKAVLALAGRINLGGFVIVVGAAMVGGALWETLL